MESDSRRMENGCITDILIGRKHLRSLSLGKKDVDECPSSTLIVDSIGMNTNAN